MTDEYAIWPCDHEGVKVEPGRVPAFFACSECGAHPIMVRPVSTLHRERLDAWVDAQFKVKA